MNTKKIDRKVNTHEVTYGDELRGTGRKNEHTKKNESKGTGGNANE